MERINLFSALDRAIAAEKDAREFYSAAAEKTDDPGGTAMFRELAAFEAHHQEHLEALKASLANDRGWIQYPARSFSKTTSTNAARRDSGGEHADALEALRVAIAAEARAQAEYTALAEQADDARGKQMFTRLAEEEALHRKLLDDQYYSLTNSGVWLWGD